MSRADPAPGSPAPQPASLDTTPVSRLAGVGPRMAERLERLGIRTVADLLFHLPLRYQDRTRVRPIGGLQPGEEAVVAGEIQLAQVRFGRRRSLVCVLADGTGLLQLRFFHFSPAQQQGLGRGARLRCFGEVRRGPSALEMVHPEYTRLEAGEAPSEELTLTPIYPTTQGIHQLSIRKLAEQALRLLDLPGALEDHLPETALAGTGLPGLEEALHAVHHPPRDAPLEQFAAARHPAQRRLAFEELLAQHLSLRILRRTLESQSAPVLDGESELAGRLLDSLPFELTGAQRRVIAEIRADLARGTPMHRLVQGDVGSGKTVVAAVAALQAVGAGHQVAVMAPTELLAEQHLRSFRAWLDPLGVKTAWLASRLGAKARAETLEIIAAHRAQVVVGTHALFQESVAFARLGLLIIDEQHRFGVHQRLALRAKGVREGSHPHQLILTATPIPRTLAMTAYADLDTSVIDEKPPGRGAVDTAVVPDTRRAEVLARVREACRAGQQAYWVCTLIEESEALQAQAAADSAARLAETLPELRVGLVHGRQKGAEKERAMAAFKAGELDLLVATTVIEVGVDVPNATLMIIENAERLGLAQLHQLRGRVGRGRAQSVCVLMYHGPLTRDARERLGVLRLTNDGFEIAQRDLELRGPGEVLGIRQTGMLQLRVADLVRDRGLLPAIEQVGSRMLAEHPDRVRALVRRWVGDAVHYADV